MGASCLCKRSNGYRTGLLTALAPVIGARRWSGGETTHSGWYGRNPDPQHAFSSSGERGGDGRAASPGRSERDVVVCLSPAAAATGQNRLESSSVWQGHRSAG